MTTPHQDFGAYRLHERIGDGPTGEVFRASRLDEDGRETSKPAGVALKRIYPPIGREPSYAAHFLGAAARARRIQHPHLAGVLDYGRHQGQLFVVTELRNGFSLSRLLQFLRSTGSGLDPVLALMLIQQLCQALTPAHSAHAGDKATPHPLVHGNLKPSNVLIEPSGHAVLLDLGCSAPAVLEPEGPLVWLSRESIRFLAPEFVRGAELDPRCDVYSLGALLFELLTLEPVIENASPLEMFRQVTEVDLLDRLKLLKDFELAPEVSRVVLGALQRKPRARFPDAKSLGDALGAVLASPRMVQHEVWAELLAELRGDDALARFELGRVSELDGADEESVEPWDLSWMEDAATSEVGWRVGYGTKIVDGPLSLTRLSPAQEAHATAASTTGIMLLDIEVDDDEWDDVTDGYDTPRGLTPLSPQEAIAASPGLPFVAEEFVGEELVMEAHEPVFASGPLELSPEELEDTADSSDDDAYEDDEPESAPLGLLQEEEHSELARALLALEAKGPDPSEVRPPPPRARARTEAEIGVSEDSFRTVFVPNPVTLVTSDNVEVVSGLEVETVSEEDEEEALMAAEAAEAEEAAGAIRDAAAAQARSAAAEAPMPSAAPVVPPISAQEAAFRSQLARVAASASASGNPVSPSLPAAPSVTDGSRASSRYLDIPVPPTLPFEASASDFASIPTQEIPLAEMEAAAAKAAAQAVEESAQPLEAARAPVPPSAPSAALAAGSGESVSDPNGDASASADAGGPDGLTGSGRDGARKRGDTRKTGSKRPKPAHSGDNLASDGVVAAIGIEVRSSTSARSSRAIRATQPMEALPASLFQTETSDTTGREAAGDARATGAPRPPAPSLPDPTAAPEHEAESLFFGRVARNPVPTRSSSPGIPAETGAEPAAAASLLSSQNGLNLWMDDGAVDGGDVLANGTVTAAGSELPALAFESDAAPATLETEPGARRLASPLSSAGEDVEPPASIERATGEESSAAVSADGEVRSRTSLPGSAPTGIVSDALSAVADFHDGLSADPAPEEQLSGADSDLETPTESGLVVSEVYASESDSIAASDAEASSDLAYVEESVEPQGAAHSDDASPVDLDAFDSGAFGSFKRETEADPIATPAQDLSLDLAEAPLPSTEALSATLDASGNPVLADALTGTSPFLSDVIPDGAARLAATLQSSLNPGASPYPARTQGETTVEISIHDDITFDDGMAEAIDGEYEALSQSDVPIPELPSSSAYDLATAQKHADGRLEEIPVGLQLSTPVPTQIPPLELAIEAAEAEVVELGGSPEDEFGEDADGELEGGAEAGAEEHGGGEVAEAPVEASLAESEVEADTAFAIDPSDVPEIELEMVPAPLPEVGRAVPASSGVAGVSGPSPFTSVRTSAAAGLRRPAPEPAPVSFESRRAGERIGGMSRSPWDAPSGNPASGVGSGPGAFGSTANAGRAVAGSRVIVPAAGGKREAAPAPQSAGQRVGGWLRPVSRRPSIQDGELVQGRVRVEHLLAEFPERTLYSAYELQDGGLLTCEHCGFAGSSGDDNFCQKCGTSLAKQRFTLSMRWDRRRIERDLMLTQRMMAHPGISPVLDQFMDEGRLYRVLELVTEDLASGVLLMQLAGPLDTRFLGEIGVQAAIALHFLHEQGMNSPFLSEDNLFLRGEKVQLFDLDVDEVMAPGSLPASMRIKDVMVLARVLINYLPPNHTELVQLLREAAEGRVSNAEDFAISIQEAAGVPSSRLFPS